MLIRKIRPDVVQTWLPQMDILGGIAALLNGVPLILSERSSAAAYSPGWKTRLRLLFGRRAAGIVANSHGGLSYWRPHLSSDRLHLVRNCVSPAEREASTSLPAVGAHLAMRPLVLFAGRFSYEKNVSVLVEAFIHVARKHTGVTILMFGEGPERESAIGQIAAAGMNTRIVLAGYSPQLSAWMTHAAVCVSVSHFEGHPNVVIEAAAAGCPLVLSDIAAHRELFDESSAALVPADSPARIAQAVLEALHNPAIARERAARARAVVALCDIATATSAYRSIYESVVCATR